MAVFDPAQNAVVIRIVYDGPPHAGKTTSVRSLAHSLSRTVETPLEANGRTMFFDWMEYTGGLFEGHQIRCQIVSVPGQPDLAARRRALLESADVVVFVADTADRDSVARSVGHVRQMTEILARGDGPPIGVVLQANKRDLPTAIPRKELAEAFGADYARAAVTESIADKNTGIRETFVLAVRLALDRIRELMARGLLPEGTPSVNSAEQLLERLEALPVPASPRMSDRADDEPDDALALAVERPTSALGEPEIEAKPAEGVAASAIAPPPNVEPARIPLAIPPPPPPLEPVFLGNAPKPVAHDATDDTWDMPEITGEATDKAHVHGAQVNGAHHDGPSDDEAIDRAIDEVLENAARVEAERSDDTVPPPIEARLSRADTEVSADLAARAVTDITNHEAFDDDEPPPPPPKRAATNGEGAQRPRSPDARVPSGAIWPPVEGRIVLHEAVATGLIVHRVGQADWIAGIGTGWRVHSSASAEYALFDDGRRALLHWARLHSTYAELLSPGRCVVLADAGGDTWRLWQIVKLMPSLRAWLVDSSDEEPRELFKRLTTAAIVLGEAWARCADTRLLPSLDSIGRGPHGPQFVALMPVVGQGAIARPTDVADRVTRELSRLLAAELVERRPDLLALLEGNDRPTTPWEELVAHAVTALV